MTRFSLRSLIALLTVSCVYLGLVFAVPPPLGLMGLFLITMIMPAMVVSGVIYSRGDARAFWIGCATSGVIPYLIASYFSSSLIMVLMFEGFDGFFNMINRSNDTFYLKVIVAVCHGLTFFNGVIVVGTKRLHQPKPAPAEEEREQSSPDEYAVFQTRYRR